MEQVKKFEERLKALASELREELGANTVEVFIRASQYECDRRIKIEYFKSEDTPNGCVCR